MEHRKSPDGIVCIRLDRGDELVASIKEACAKEKVAGASVSGIGACRSAEIAHYDTKEKRYHNKVLEGMMEIISLSGNITLSEGQPFPHLHITLGLSDFSVNGGHLIRAVIDPTCEVMIVPSGAGIRREYDGDTGLRTQRF